jgi:hypothetical protein
MRAESIQAGRALIADLDKLQAEMAGLAGQLVWLEQQGFVLRQDGMVVDAGARRVLHRLNMPTALWQDLKDEALTGRVKWGDALDRLLQDAGAAVP